MGKYPSFLKTCMRALDSGYFVIPKGWEALSRYRTDELQLQHAPPKAKYFPETRLFQELVRKRPEVQLDTMELNSFKPPLGRRFVLRQIELMQSGMKKHAAFKQVEQEMAGEFQRLSGQASSEGSYLRLAQREEDVQLQQALQTLHKNSNRIKSTSTLPA